MDENLNNREQAPGWPGMPLRWTSSSKSGIGKSINLASDVSFTLSHGIVNEVFFPREDIACIRDIEFLVTDGKDFFSEEKSDTSHAIKWMKEGVPAFHIVNVQFTQARYIKQKVTSPYEVWRFNNQRKTISNKKTLRIELMADAIIHWTNDNCQTSNNLNTTDTGLETFVGDIFPKNENSEKIIFTIFWKKANHWENTEFEINVISNENLHS